MQLANKRLLLFSAEGTVNAVITTSLNKFARQLLSKFTDRCIDQSAVLSRCSGRIHTFDAIYTAVFPTTRDFRWLGAAGLALRDRATRGQKYDICLNTAGDFRENLIGMDGLAQCRIEL